MYLAKAFGFNELDINGMMEPYKMKELQEVDPLDRPVEWKYQNEKYLSSYCLGH